MRGFPALFRGINQEAPLRFDVQSSDEDFITERHDRLNSSSSPLLLPRGRLAQSPNPLITWLISVLTRYHPKSTHLTNINVGGLRGSGVAKTLLLLRKAQGFGVYLPGTGREAKFFMLQQCLEQLYSSLPNP